MRDCFSTYCDNGKETRGLMMTKYKNKIKHKIACCLLDSSTKFNVVHYTVEMINE